MKSSSITICIPAYNEESNILTTIQTVERAAKLAKVTAYNILILNDGSTDKTEEIVKAVARKNSKIILENNERNSGIGFTIKKLIQLATGDKICFVPGDDILSLHTLHNYFTNMHKADIIFVYFINKEERSAFRIFLSLMFNLICTFMFNAHVNYINGSGIYNASLLKKIDIRSHGYFISAEMNLKLLLQGATFYEVGGYIKSNVTKSNAIKVRNLIDVMYCFLRLFFEVKFFSRGEYSRRPKRIIEDMK